MKKTVFGGLTIFVMACVLNTIAFAQENSTVIRRRNPILATRAAQQPTVYEMQCRGGSKKDFPITARYELGNTSNHYLTRPAGLTLRFTKSATSATAGNLSPGECTWMDRPINNQEPSELQFEALGREIEAIVKRMGSAKGYSSFMVYNTNKGYFRATSHKNIKILSDSVRITERVGGVVIGGSTTSEPSQPKQKITSVYVKQSLNHADFNFLTVRPATAYVEISTRAPVIYGHLTFNQRFVVSRATVNTNDSRTATKVRLSNLKPGTRYYYIITINEANNEKVQETGDFYTSVRID